MYVILELRDGNWHRMGAYRTRFMAYTGMYRLERILPGTFTVIYDPNG